MHKTTVFYTRVCILLSFVFWPIIFFLIFLRKNRDKEKTLEKVRILILPQLTRIGDIVCTTPIFRAIKEKYPNSHIAVLSSLNAYEIIKNNPRIDEILIIEDWKDNFLGFFRKIQESRFDWGISLSGTAFSSVLFFYGLIPNRLKITRERRPLAEVFSDWMCGITEKYVTLSYLPIFYLKMLRYLEIYSSEDKKEVFCHLGLEDRVDTFLKSKQVSPEDRILGISLTAGNRIKEWGDEKFELLSREIHKNYGMKIVFIGSPREKKRIDSLLENLGGSGAFLSAVGFSIEELPNLMKRFSYFISVDTGPMHIAHALGVPLVDILGPVNSIELTPTGRGVVVVKSPSNIPSTIFAFREELSQDLTRKSMDAITVGQVVEAFHRLFRRVEGSAHKGVIV